MSAVRSPQKGNARREPGADTTESYKSDYTPEAGAVTSGAARYQVRTRKANGVVVTFNVYTTHAEARAVAERLAAVGGNAHVVEVRHDC